MGRKVRCLPEELVAFVNECAILGNDETHKLFNICPNSEHMLCTTIAKRLA
jgi:hypothetical protein